MAFSTKAKAALNSALTGLNLKVESLTAERQEAAQLDALSRAGLFDRPVYSLLPGMESFDIAPLVDAYAKYAKDLQRLATPGGNDVEYDIENTYFTSPDMEVLYLLMRTLAPARVVEIGCGNSTRITRQAIKDGGLSTRITAIDPWPRTDIADYVDAFLQSRVELISNYDVFESLESGDVLFIDSSHELKLGNDVARIFCDIIPRLKPGVIVHFHDIFLPFEYGKDRLQLFAGWGEQYILHALLQGKPADILWPGHYLQRTRSGIETALPFMAGGTALSFWFRLR